MRTLLAALILILAAPAHAADVTAHGSDITIVGSIAKGDDERFVGAITAQTKTVFLTSPGGDFTTSLKIARHVRVQELETVVGHYAVCSSGCAIIWFAGVKRRIMIGGRIGVHSAATTIVATGESTRN
jgi:hypothetical protein